MGLEVIWVDWGETLQLLGLIFLARCAWIVFRIMWGDVNKS